MNYQFPLLNLVTRGHLAVKNFIATKRVIEQLDNDSCKAILENLVSINDSRLCARKMDEVTESFNLKTGNRILVSESVLKQSMDAVLEHDSSERRQVLAETQDYEHTGDMAIDIIKEKANKIMALLGVGSTTMAIYKLATMPPEEKMRVIEFIKNTSTGAYNVLKANGLFGKLLPKDLGYFGRTASSVWKFKNDLNADDKAYNMSALKGVGIGALIATSIVAAIAGISMAYKRWFSAAAKVCRGMSGKKRTICMCNAIIAASEKAMKKAEKALLECDSAKDPQECRYKMKVEIRSWHKKIEEQKRKLVKIGMVNKSPYGNKSDTTDVPVSTNPFE